MPNSQRYPVHMINVYFDQKSRRYGWFSNKYLTAQLKSC